MHEDKQIEAARRLLTHAAEVLAAPIAIRLWNGETFCLSPDAPDDVLLAINDPGAIGRLLRHPRLTTLVDLLAAGDFDIVGGTLLDVAARVGTVNRRAFRSLDKKLVLKSRWPFLFAGRGGRSRSRPIRAPSTRRTTLS